MSTRSIALAGFAGLLGLLLAQAAPAVPYSVTGQYQSSCCNFPVLGLGTIPINVFPFAVGGGANMRTGHAPTQVVSVQPGGTLNFGADVVKMNAKFIGNPPPFPPSFLFISSEVGWHNAPGVLAPGGGPGNVAYCPNNPGTNPNCTAPGNAGAPFNGLISHTSPGGSPNFGGTLVLLGGNRVAFQRTGGAPSVVLSGSNTNLSGIQGGPFENYDVNVQTVMIKTPGGTNKVTSTLIQAALPWGTGTIYGVASGQPAPIPPTLSFSYAGTDMRTQAGAGNITLVSPNLATSTAGFTFMNGVRLKLNLIPEPRAMTMLAAGSGLLIALGGLRRWRQS